MTSANKSFSVEDITAALDDMIEDSEYLRENAHADHGARPGAEARRKMSGLDAAQQSVGSADEELDALSLALKGFPPERKPNKLEAEEKE